MLSMFHVANRSRFRDVVQAEITAALRRHGGNVRQVSAELGVPYRTLQRWITSFKLRGLVKKSRREHAAARGSVAA